MRGVSQTRIRRFATLLSAEPGPFHALPSGWTQVLPPDAPLTTSDAWNRLLVRLTAADWPDGENHAETLCSIIALLAKGPEAASEIGESLLKGRALAIWRKSLLTGPAGLWCKFVRGAQQSQWRGKDYAASTAFQIAGAVGFLRWKCPRPNCPLRIRRSSSIPAMVVAAQSKSLKPSIGPVRDLMPR